MIAIKQSLSGSYYQAEIEQLEKHIENFDYESAVSELGCLANSLEKSIG